MSDQLTLAAEARDRAGKGASRALRREGRVPAVIYGNNQDPQAIHLEEKALVKALGSGHFMNSVVMVGGQRTLPKDVAFHPVSDRPIHVDFLRISEHATVRVQVPVHFVDEEESAYLKKGGVLNVVAHDLEVICDAAEIPSEITVSLKGRDVGDSIHIGDLTLPRGVTSAVEELTIATIVPPTVPTAEDDAADAEVAEAQAADAAEADGETGEGDAAEGSIDS